MSLTKPAGAFLQLVGGCVLFAGIGFVIPNPFWGLVLLAAGGWLLWAGGRPARRKT